MSDCLVHGTSANRPADGKTAKKLVPQALALRDGREAAVLNLLGVQLKGVLGEFEALLHEGSKLADAATLLAKDLLGVGGTDDNLRVSESLRKAVILKMYRWRTSVRAWVTRTSHPE